MTYFKSLSSQDSLMRYQASELTKAGIEEQQSNKMWSHIGLALFIIALIGAVAGGSCLYANLLRDSQFAGIMVGVILIGGFGGGVFIANQALLRSALTEEQKQRFVKGTTPPPEEMNETPPVEVNQVAQNGEEPKSPAIEEFNIYMAMHKYKCNTTS